MDKEEMERVAHLWRTIGEIRALAKPDGFIAKDLGHTAEKRIAEIWKLLQTINP